MGALICRIIQKHLSLPLQFIGNISYDDLVHDAVCQKVPFLEKYLHTQTAMELEKFCKQILGARSKREGSGPSGGAPEMAAAGAEQ